MQTLNVLDNRFSPLNTYNTLSTDAHVAESFTQSLFDKRQKVAFMSELQTTLELDQLLNIFSIEAARYIDFSGLYFKSPHLNKTLRGSRKAKKERCFELRMGDDFVGTLTYGINSPISLTNFKVLEQLHHCLLYPIKNAIAYHDAVQLAMQDGLTGLGNRRYFDEQLKRAMHNANRHHSLVGLVLGDLNKFKAINDSFGHVTGDLVLKEFADVLRQCTRESDSIFRFGGDEFAIIVENSTDSALIIIENRIEAILKNNPLLSQYQLSCSIGSTFMSRADNEVSFFERADQLLYRKKMQGSARLSVV
ncbi:GGDEF domain-containing protein [Colwellia sp. E2M01]|uniref:GGDEF domain-containing protein n=1 Tax=Colwellia sp. E2M01 TaxID=2841561 RepID=UPI001C0A1636|nr:GGDEF domain-containing protein [Colwellia sp. E2M01]MBU2869178.1 GGDEF domain-containing protein [Colwellia sp. E2M01]